MLQPQVKQGASVGKPSEPRTLWDERVKGKWNEGWPPSNEAVKSDAKALEGDNTKTSNRVKAK